MQSDYSVSGATSEASSIYSGGAEDVFLVCATHSYQSRDQCDLPFEAGDHFLVLEPPGPEMKWIHVITEVGVPGYVPRSYVELVKTTTANVVDFLEGCMEAIQLNAVQRGGVYNARERSLLQVLSHKRKMLTEPMSYDSSTVASTSMSSVSLTSGASSSYASTCSSYPQFAEMGSSNATLQSGGSVASSSRSKPPAPKPPPRSPNTSLNSIPNAVQSCVGSFPAASATSYLDVTRSAGGYFPQPDQHIASNHGEGLASEVSNDTLINGEITNVAKIAPPKQPEPIKNPERRHLTGLCAELVEAVRVETNLSHAGSKQAVVAVLKKLGERVRKLGPDLFPLVDHLEDCDSLSPELIAESRDAVKLRTALNELMAARFDEQQRGWHLHEDEASILSCLDSILDIMGGADVAVTRFVVSEDNYSRIVDIVVYFQMETRRSIRLKVLETLNLLCALEPKVIPVLLSSVLPLELIRDILASRDDKERASRCIMLLATILSLGDRLPVHYFEQITPSFLEYIVSNVIDDCADDSDPLSEGLQIHCFILLLGLNLQYPNPEINPVLAALKGVSHAPALTERLLLHFNRGEDPLDMVEVDTPRTRPDSITKLLTDMFSDEKTSYLFYTNDVNAMMDMIIRILTDLSEDDPGKEPYFRLLFNVVIQTSYEDNLHRKPDIHRCLKIGVHSEKSTPETRALAKAICDRFPKLFPL